MLSDALREASGITVARTEAIVPGRLLRSALAILARQAAHSRSCYKDHILTEPLGDAARQWAASPKLTVHGPLLAAAEYCPSTLASRGLVAVHPQDGTLAVEVDPMVRADAAMARLGDNLGEAWPILALALHDPSEAIRIRACWLLDGCQADPLPEIWIDAIVGAAPPYRHGADPWTFAARYAAVARPSDALVECCLQAVRDGNWAAAILVSGCIDRDDVFEAFIAGYPKLALADAWETHPGAPGSVLDHTAGALVGASSAHTLRQEGSAVALPALCGGHHRHRPAPREPGPNRLPDGSPGAVTSALLRRPEPRAVAAFRQAADDTRLSLHVRTAATLALVELRAPEAAKRWSHIEAAWERYWRI